MAVGRKEVREGFYIYDDVRHGGPLILEEVEDDVTTPGDEAAERGTDRAMHATNGALHQDTPFMQVIGEIVDLHLKKQADYGSDHDPFANVRASADFGVPAWVGCMIRANDKMKRIQKAAHGGTLVNESLEDSLMDLAVYSIIGLVLVREVEINEEGK